MCNPITKFCGNCHQLQSNYSEIKCGKIYHNKCPIYRFTQGIPGNYHHYHYYLFIEPVLELNKSNE